MKFFGFLCAFVSPWLKSCEMTETERSLLDAVLENPDDDLPRLVYADYLDENGDPKRAEFIRAQITIIQQSKALAFDSDEFTLAMKRILSLQPNDYASIIDSCCLISCEPTSIWVDAFNDAIRVRNANHNITYHFRRGFVETITANWSQIFSMNERLPLAPLSTIYSQNQGEYGGLRIDIQRFDSSWNSSLRIDHWRNSKSPLTKKWLSRSQLFSGVLNWASRRYQAGTPSPYTLLT